jgi:hypothetical protein
VVAGGWNWNGANAGDETAYRYKTVDDVRRQGNNILEKWVAINGTADTAQNAYEAAAEEKLQRKISAAEEKRRREVAVAEEKRQRKIESEKKETAWKGLAQRQSREVRRRRAAEGRRTTANILVGDRIIGVGRRPILPDPVTSAVLGQVMRDLRDPSQRPIHVWVSRHTSDDDAPEPLALVIGPGVMGVDLEFEDGRIHIIQVNRDGTEKFASILQEGSKPARPDRKRAAPNDEHSAASESTDTEAGSETESDSEVSPPRAQQAAAKGMPADGRETGEALFDDKWWAEVWAITGPPQGLAGEGDVALDDTWWADVWAITGPP